MPRTRSWRALLPGVVALAVLVGGGAAVLVFGQIGALHGRTFPLYATVDEATGLSAGSEVWLAGQKVGVVRAVEFRAPSTDTSHRLLLSLTVLEKHRAVIRRGARVQIRPGGNLVGAPIVALGIGAAAQPAVQPGDTLRADPTSEFENVRMRFAGATAQVPVVMANVRVLAAQLHAARGTLGALGIEGANQLSAISGTASRTIALATTGPGTTGRLLSGRLTARARAALARVDTVRALVTSPDARTSIGRFRRDSTLGRTIASIQAELAEVSQLLEEPRGTAGRLQRDSALALEVARGRAELSAIMVDVKRNPLRYIAF